MAQLGIKHYSRKPFLPGVLTKFGYNLVWLESGHMVAVIQHNTTGCVAVVFSNYLPPLSI